MVKLATEMSEQTGQMQIRHPPTGHCWTEKSIRHTDGQKNLSDTPMDRKIYQTHSKGQKNLSDTLKDRKIYQTH